MVRIFLTILMFATGTFAQLEKARIDTFKKEAVPLQVSIEEALNSVVPGPAGVLTHPQATYLEGYGVVVSLEVALEPTRTMFSSPKTPAEVRATVTQRRKSIEDKLAGLLKDRVVKMQSVGDSESLTIAVHLFNSNPADLPNYPAQIVLTVKKQNPATFIVQEF